MKKYIKPTNPKKVKISQPNKYSSASNHKKNTINDGNALKKQKVFKSQSVVPTKEHSLKEMFIRRNDTPKERAHPEYGTSKLEEKFAKNFLDKLGVKYETQFKAESICRYYDFYIESANLLIEIDGGYWHSDPRLVEGKELTPTQKRNKRVDKDKDKWATSHKIPLLRIWEYDINNEPLKVMEQLKKDIKFYTEKHNKEKENKKRPNTK